MQEAYDRYSEEGSVHEDGDKLVMDTKEMCTISVTEIQTDLSIPPEPPKPPPKPPQKRGPKKGMIKPPVWENMELEKERKDVENKSIHVPSMILGAVLGGCIVIGLLCLLSK